MSLLHSLEGTGINETFLFSLTVAVIFLCCYLVLFSSYMLLWRGDASRRKIYPKGHPLIHAPSERGRFAPQGSKRK